MDAISLVLLCSDGSKFTIECRKSETIQALRSQICRTIDCESADLRLIHAGKEIKNLNITIKDSGIGLRDNFNVHCAVKPTQKSKEKKAVNLTGSVKTEVRLVNVRNDIPVDLTDDPIIEVASGRKRGGNAIQNSSKRARENPVIIEL